MNPHTRNCAYCWIVGLYIFVSIMGLGPGFFIAGVQEYGCDIDMTCHTAFLRWFFSVFLIMYACPDAKLLFHYAYRGVMSSGFSIFIHSFVHPEFYNKMNIDVPGCIYIAVSNLPKGQKLATLLSALCLWLIFPVSAYGQEDDFEYIGNHIYLETEVNGKPAKLVFDTGADDLSWQRIRGR